MPCRSVLVVLPWVPTELITVYETPPILSAVLEEDEMWGRFMTPPVPILNAPMPLAASKALAMFGLMAMPAFDPLAVTAAFTFTSLEAASVRMVLALQVIVSLTFTSPEPPLVPALLCSVMLLLARLLERVSPVMLPPEAATV